MLTVYLWWAETRHGDDGERSSKQEVIERVEAITSDVPRILEGASSAQDKGKRVAREDGSEQLGSKHKDLEE